ncbi:glycosyl transferase family 2 [Sphingomonas sp. Leaf357]|uniref:glycosyltransferase n=1 Tax=Sphingomonas sp. Leaf357 TaxID=1736350 RepID=UPI0006F2FA5F|nr:glycosyltransferase [Sphingomonas sp. Leaf357]KQS02193.1 glycosyl transferase family 2 [Sphingomonas sp. Leaf357]
MTGRTAICVPVRDEAALLPRFLDALAAQDRQDFTLCILFDGCADASVAIVTARAASLPFGILTAEVAAGAPNAGLARRRAMELGLSVLDDDGMIVSTDADSVPARDWSSANAAALAVAEVAAGRIVREGGRQNAVQDRVERYYDALFALRRAIDPVAWEAPETHHYTSGASLAFRASAYRALGGFEPIASAEDARLVDAAHHAGLRIRRDAAIRVATSARRSGRAIGGLADHLRKLDAGEAEATMAHPEDAVWRYQRQAAARAAWPDFGAGRSTLAAALDSDPTRVERIALEAPNAEAFAMRVVPDRPGGERIVTLDTAEAALARISRNERVLAA